MRAIKQRKQSQGLTIIEMIVIVAVVALLVGLIGLWAYREIQNVYARFTLTWTKAPTTIPPAPGTGTFVYHVTRQLDASSPIENYKGRSVKFDLAVTKGNGTIVSCNAQVLPSPSMTCTADSDANGDLTIIVSLEKNGEANLTATDVKTNKSDPPKSFSAP